MPPTKGDGMEITMKDYYDSDGPNTPPPQSDFDSLNTNDSNNIHFNESDFHNTHDDSSKYTNAAPPKHHRQTPSTPPNNLAIAAFSLSLFSIIGCCCCSSFSSSYLIILFEVLSITLAILSKRGQRMHGLAIAAIVISSITLICTAFLIVFSIYLQTHPEALIGYLRSYVDILKESGLNDDELNYLRQMLRQLGIDPNDVGLFFHHFK